MALITSFDSDVGEKIEKIFKENNMELTDGQKVQAGYWEGIDPNDNEIETNKAVTIDASAYTVPVVVNPTDNYDAMKKVTVTVSNLPVSQTKSESITSNTTTEIVPDEGKLLSKVTVTTNVSAYLYAWKHSTDVIYTKTAEPTTSDKALIGAATGLSEGAITAVADEFASITVSATEYERYSAGDIEVL